VQNSIIFVLFWVFQETKQDLGRLVTDLDLAAARVRESVGQVHACVAHGAPDNGARPHHVLPRLCVIKIDMFRTPSNSLALSRQKISIC
jgi:hypothetical protein